MGGGALDHRDTGWLAVRPPGHTCRLCSGSSWKARQHGLFSPATLSHGVELPKGRELHVGTSWCVTGVCRMGCKVVSGMCEEGVVVLCGCSFPGGCGSHGLSQGEDSGGAVNSKSHQVFIF